MMSRYKMEDDERYEQDYYDDYEEEEEVEEEEVEELPSKEEQDFLKLREELKEKFRKQLKQQTNGGSKSQVKKATVKNDSFGSFFGPSKPVIASRVLDESRSIRETQHILSSKTSKSLSNHVKDHSSSDKKTTVRKPQPVVNEVKKKAQTLKDMRDYSFLLSDDADVPDVKEEQKQPVRKPSIHDARSTQEQIRSKQQLSKPTRPIPNGHLQKNPASRNPQSQTRMAPAKGTPLNKSRPITTAPKKPDVPRNGSSRPLVQKKVIQSKPSSQPIVNNRPQANSSKIIPMKNKSAPVVSQTSAQKNRYPEQPKRHSQSINNRPMVSSKSQPLKKIPPQYRREERVVSKQPMKRKIDDVDEDQSAISMIRQMFKYNPGKYSDDEDVSDMEADFHEIEREERRSLKIARMEDEEQARLIEEEERRERMRKKQKLKRG